MPGGVQQLAYPEAVLIKPTSPALQCLSQILNEATCLLTENRIKNRGEIIMDRLRGKSAGI